MDDALPKRLQILEEKFEYQDKTLDDLNDVIIDQNKQIAQMQEQIARLEALLTNLQEGDGDDPPPPHY